MANTVGYHGAAAAYSNDDSMGSITGSIAQMQMANNTNARALNGNISTISTSTNELRQALLVTQQQLAALAWAVNQPNAPPLPAFNHATMQPVWMASQPPPLSAAVHHTNTAVLPYIPPPNLPVPQTLQVPLPSGYYGGARRGRGQGRGRGGRGRGRHSSVCRSPASPCREPSNWSTKNHPPLGGGGGGRGGGCGNAPTIYKR